MATPGRLVVFDALMLRSLILAESQAENPGASDLEAFRIAFQSRRFSLLVTDGILDQYLSEARKFPFFNPLPRINSLRQQSRATYLEEYNLNRSNIQLFGLPQEHQEFIRDAIGARAAYCITNREEWLNLPRHNDNLYGLQIVSPSGFVELEGP